jgi:hypothetical protein
MCIFSLDDHNSLCRPPDVLIIVGIKVEKRKKFMALGEDV